MRAPFGRIRLRQKEGLDEESPSVMSSSRKWPAKKASRDTVAGDKSRNYFTRGSSASWGFCNSSPGPGKGADGNAMGLAHTQQYWIRLSKLPRTLAPLLRRFSCFWILSA